MAESDVARNLKGMDALDFKVWNDADWDGVFAHYHTDDVLVDVHGQPTTQGIQEHIAAMKAFVESTGGTPIRSSLTRSRSAPESGRVSWASWKAAVGW